MKLPIKHKYFEEIKKGRKLFEYRDAHITFIDETTGEGMRIEVENAGVCSNLPDDVPKRLFEDKVFIWFKLKEPENEDKLVIKPVHNAKLDTNKGQNRNLSSSESSNGREASLLSPLSSENIEDKCSSCDIVDCSVKCDLEDCPLLFKDNKKTISEQVMEKIKKEYQVASYTTVIPLVEKTIVLTAQLVRDETIKCNVEN